MVDHSSELETSLPQSPSCFFVNVTYKTERKEIGDVLARIAGLLVILAIATVLVTPPLVSWMPLWKAMVVMFGAVLIYLGISFFVRPQVDYELLSWRNGSRNLGRAANIQRLLFLLHWLLAPGRFAAETLLDCFVLLGLTQGHEDEEPEA